jgi:hypothetical protein
MRRLLHATGILPARPRVQQREQRHGQGSRQSQTRPASTGSTPLIHRVEPLVNRIYEWLSTAADARRAQPDAMTMSEEGPIRFILDLETCNVESRFSPDLFEDIDEEDGAAASPESPKGRYRPFKAPQRSGDASRRPPTRGAPSRR